MLGWIASNRYFFLHASESLNRRYKRNELRGGIRSVSAEVILRFRLDSFGGGFRLDEYLCIIMDKYAFKGKSTRREEKELTKL